MRKIIAYTAQSLDGFIADPSGGIQWLETIPNPDNTDYGYTDFYESIDTTIMGNSTYQQIRGFDVPFPYPDKKNYVLTRDSAKPRDPHVEFVSNDATSFLKDLKNKPGGNIWLVGGASANALCLTHGLLDELMVFVMPVVLGNGVPLFRGGFEAMSLQLIHSKPYTSGAILLHYRVKK